jgi:hypothetical protein
MNWNTLGNVVWWLLLLVMFAILIVLTKNMEEFRGGDGAD